MAKPEDGSGALKPIERLGLATFGRRLRELRLNRNLSASDLARQVWGETTDNRGYTVARNRDRISAYESGRARPEETNLIAIAKALDVTVEELAPDLVANQIDGLRHPALSMTMVEGHPDKVRLIVNSLTSLATASEVIRILSQDPLTATTTG